MFSILFRFLFYYYHDYWFCPIFFSLFFQGDFFARILYTRFVQCYFWTCFCSNNKKAHSASRASMLSLSIYRKHSTAQPAMHEAAKHPCADQIAPTQGSKADSGRESVCCRESIARIFSGCFLWAFLCTY